MTAEVRKLAKGPHLTLIHNCLMTVLGLTFPPRMPRQGKLTLTDALTFVELRQNGKP